MEPQTLNIQSAFFGVGGRVYFTNRTYFEGSELWQTDGTDAGTVLVADIFPGGENPYNASYIPNNGNPADLSGLAGTLLFTAQDAGGYHLWTSTGANGATLPVDKLQTDTYSGQVLPLIALDGKVLLTANDGESPGLWSSDGTAAGTQRLAKLPQVTNLTNINGTAYFGGSDDDDFHSQTELWKSDGTAAGTMLVRDINLHTAEGGEPPYFFRFGSEPTGFTELGGKAIFSASDGGNSYDPQDYRNP
jgi:ELWxxDGT repeat protein